MDWLKDFLRPELIWFLVGLVLLAAELVVPGLIIFFFGVGACVVAVVCLFVELPLNGQLLLFIFCSILLLALLRAWVKGIFMGHITSRQDMNEDLKEFIGERAVVKTTITPKLAGKVELHGTNWVAEADEEVAEGTVVEIVDKDNITLKVKPVR